MANHDLENRYYRFLRDRGYSSTAALDDVLRAYVPYLRNHHRVLDVGCGHGEFMRLLLADGHEAMGVDIDPGMVAACHAAQLDVVRADVLAWLPEQPAHFDAIFSTNVMEHLTPAQVDGLVRAAYAALRPGGLLLLGVPNPESIIVQLHEFWRDPTHVRLYSSQLLEFFLTSAGFQQVQSGQNEAARWEGIDQFLAAVEEPLPARPPIATHPQPQAAAQPLPPGAQSSWRQRLAYAIARLVYTKCVEPFVTPTHRFQVAAAQVADQNMATLAESYRLSQERVERLDQRLRELSRAYRFLYPSREVFVYGYKPAAAG